MKPRTPGSVEDALIIIYGHLGVEDAALAVGKSTQHVRRWSDPDDDALPNIQQAMQLEKACIRASGAQPLSDVWSRVMLAAASAAARPAEPLPDSILDVTGKVGELANMVRKSMADGQVSRSEGDQILRAIAQLRTQTDELEAALMAVRLRGRGV